MTTLKIIQIKTGQITTAYIHDKDDAIKQGKWYLSLKENGSKKYRVLVSKN